MSEHKTTWDLIAEIDYEIEVIKKERLRLLNEQVKASNKIDQLRERRKSIISYENTDSDSINQDKTE